MFYGGRLIASWLEDFFATSYNSREGWGKKIRKNRVNYLPIELTVTAKTGQQPKGDSLKDKSGIPLE